MTREEAIYCASWIEGVTVALWQFTGDRLADETVALMEERAHALVEYVASTGGDA